VVRALAVPLLALCLGLGVLEAFRANGLLSEALLAEARRVAEAGALGVALERLGGRLTASPPSPLPLLGEGVEGVEVGPTGLRVWVARPSGPVALVVERAYPLYLPALGPYLVLFLLAFLWARARVLGEVQGLLGLSLGAAKERLAALEAALASLEEGVAIVRGGRVVYLNRRALALLGLPEGAMTPLALERVWPALAAARGAEVLPLPGGRPARVRESASAGYQVIVFQDHAELRRLAESLTQSRRHLDLLRAQTHEFQNFLHLLGGLLELGRVEEALRLLRSEGEVEARLEEVLARVELPLLAALLLGKWRRAQELGVEMALEGHLPARYAPFGDLLASVLGQLLENALEAAAQRPGGQVRLRFRAEEEGLYVEVRDNGPGPKGEVLFQPEASGRGAGRGYGLALARTLVRAAGGELGYRREEGWTAFWVAFGRLWTERSS